ncbi:hypothetical protein IW262DRAFT_1302110 [Armillaria fumosa]|nr:hypothetical protein IW262DRAFT_1302110 [Armillaria fumosa]
MAKFDVTGKEIEGIKQVMNVEKVLSIPSTTEDTIDTMIHQVIVKVPCLLKHRPPKKATPKARAKKAIPPELTKVAGCQTRTSQKATEEAELDDEHGVTAPTIVDHLDQDLTQDYDNMPALVQVLEDKEDIVVPAQTQLEDENAAAIIESYLPRHYEKIKTVVHDNGKEFAVKFLTYALPGNHQSDPAIFGNAPVKEQSLYKSPGVFEMRERGDWQVDSWRVSRQSNTRLIDMNCPIGNSGAIR